MSLAKIAGFGADWIDLDRPFNGFSVLRARLDIGTDDAPSLGQTSCVFDDGNGVIEYAMTIVESSNDNGDAYIVAVGGRGQLSRIIEGDDYSQPPPRLVLSAILEGVGEVAGDIDGLDSLDRIEPVYARATNAASRQLDALCNLVGARWYTRPDGAINAGPPTWLTYAGDAFVIHNANAHGIIIAEPALPDIEPGSIVGGIRVGRVRYFVDKQGLTAHLYVVPS